MASISSSSYYSSSCLHTTGSAIRSLKVKWGEQNESDSEKSRQLSYSQDLLKYIYLLVDYFKCFLFDTYINSKALSTWNDMNMYRKTHTKQQKNDELTHATTDPRLTIIPLILYICVDKTTRIDLIHQYYIYYKILYSYRRIDLGLFNDLGLFFSVSSLISPVQIRNNFVE